MLFQEEHIPLIRSGEKDVTRRDWTRPQVKVGGVYQAATEMFVAHEDCDCWIRVDHIKQEKLQAMFESDARREGYDSLEEYREVWEDINDEEWDPDKQVTVVEFTYIGEETPESKL